MANTIYGDPYDAPTRPAVPKPAIGGITDTAESIRSVADELPQGRVRDFATRTAETIDDAAMYLRDTPPNEILDDLRAQARARPLPFFIGALALGFIVGRLLRQS